MRSALAEQERRESARRRAWRRSPGSACEDMPSIWTRISVFTRRLASCSPAAPRELHRLSTSSMKMVLGAMARAISNRHRTMRSDSPLRPAAQTRHEQTSSDLV